MKKITRDKIWSLSQREMVVMIDSLQSELEALDGRTWLDSVNEMIDWKTVVGPHIDIVGYQKNGATVGRFGTIYRPLPPKVTRERTNHQLCLAWVEEQYHKSEMPEDEAWMLLANELADGKSLKNLCTAAGISLTEEV